MFLDKKIVTLFLLGYAFLANSADIPRKKHQLVHQKSAITVDGVLDETSWHQATKMNLAYENNPGEGIPAPVKTEIYFFENGDSLNIAIKAYDPEPKKIRASLRDRDALWADDYVGIIIDTFNDERGAFEFYVNPLGAQADAKMTDVNGWDGDDSWDAIWASTGKITDFGYVVEMSIPFNALRFPQSNGELIWNVAGWRNYPRDVRMQMATYKKNRNIKCNLCQFDQLVGFESVEPSSNFQLTPTLTVSRHDEKPQVPAEWENGDIDSEPGLDVRWGISQDVVFNGTINPDFSQVEADSGQLAVNSTFSLYFPEKRPFFLDGASYFDTSLYNFVHTRNIAEPDVGLKLTGQTNQHSYGVMLANDNQTSFIIPEHSGSDLAELNKKSDVAIVRYKIDVGQRSSIGGLLTHRETNDYHNTLASIDGNYRFSPIDNFRFQVAHSDSDNPGNNTGEFHHDFGLDDQQQGHAIKLVYDRNTRNYDLKARYENVAEDFRADLGFIRKVNFERVVLGGRKKWYGDSDNTFTEWGYFGDWDISYDQNGNFLEEEYEIHGNIQGNKQLYSDFGIIHRETFYDGKYFNINQALVFAEFTPTPGLEVGAFVRIGKHIDYANTRLGDGITIENFATWDANEHLNIRINYDFNELTVDDDRLFTAHQTDIRLGYQFNMRSKLKFVFQYTDIDRNTNLYLVDENEDEPESKERYFSTQLIYSYKVNPQTLFFVGYSDGGFQDDNLDELERNNRTIFTKFSYAWQL